MNVYEAMKIISRVSARLKAECAHPQDIEDLAVAAEVMVEAHKKLNALYSDLSWTVNPDRMGS